MECVSKQWRRLVFNKQFVIELKPNSHNKNSINRVLDDRTELNEQHLESVLKKCPNIIRVDLYLTVNSSVLSLIGQYCHRIKSLCYTNEFENAMEFFGINGHKLEELKLVNVKEERDENNSQDIKPILDLCPNLKNIGFSGISVLFSDNIFLPKLEHIISEFEIDSERIDNLKILSDKNRLTLKTLNIELYNLTPEELKTCIEYISRFENLTELKILIDSNDTEEPIDDCLTLIGQKCTKILKLDLNIDLFVPISEQFFDLFKDFKAIEKLILYLPHSEEVYGSIECFKHCKQLKHLDIFYDELTEDFFTDIEKFLPKLQLLKIESVYKFSNSFINSFHSMKNMQKVSLTFNNEENQESYKKIWYFGKCLSEVMLSPNGMNVKHINDNCARIIDEDDLINDSYYYSYSYSDSDSE